MYQHALVVGLYALNLWNRDRARSNVRGDMGRQPNHFIASYYFCCTSTYLRIPLQPLQVRVAEDQALDCIHDAGLRAVYKHLLCVSHGCKPFTTISW